MIAEMKGTVYTAVPVEVNGLETWTEKVTLAGVQIAERINEERTGGWKVSVKITLPKRAERSQETAWTENSDASWKGVTV